MSEDAHFSGEYHFEDDEPLFNRAMRWLAGDAIYICPKCAGPRRAGMRCSGCDRNAFIAHRYAFQKRGWLPLSCPMCGHMHTSGEEACARCLLPYAAWDQFVTSHSTNSQRHEDAQPDKRAFCAPEVPTEFDHALLNGMKIAWFGDTRK